LKEVKPTNFFVLAGSRVEVNDSLNRAGFDLIMSNGERRNMQVIFIIILFYIFKSKIEIKYFILKLKIQNK